MNERRQYTDDELDSLPVGTIYSLHWKSPQGLAESAVWKVVDDGISQLVGKSSIPPISTVMAASGSDLSIEGYDASAVIHDYGNKKMRIYLNRKLDITPGKYAAHAVHAALLAFGVHPGVPVVVLQAGPTKIEQMRIHVNDAGHTELEPGTLTSGTDWPEDSDA